MIQTSHLLVLHLDWKDINSAGQLKATQHLTTYQTLGKKTNGLIVRILSLDAVVHVTMFSVNVCAGQSHRHDEVHHRCSVLADKDYVPLWIHFYIEFHQPSPSLENGRFQWLVHRFGTLCQQTFGTLQTSLLSSIISGLTFLTSVLILSRLFMHLCSCFSGFRLYIELCNMPVDSFFCN